MSWPFDGRILVDHRTINVPEGPGVIYHDGGILAARGSDSLLVVNDGPAPVTLRIPSLEGPDPLHVLSSGGFLSLEGPDSPTARMMRGHRPC